MDCIKYLQAVIRNILVNNGLTELCLGEPDELDDPTYIIWYDRHCEPNEDPVLKVCLEFMPIFWKCWSVTASAGVRPVAGRSRGSSGIVVPDAVIS